MGEIKHHPYFSYIMLCSISPVSTATTIIPQTQTTKKGHPYTTKKFQAHILS